VAEILEIGVAAVNSAHQRARETLRTHLPSGRREDWRSPEFSARERTVLDGFIAAHEAGDSEAALALLHDDIRVTMPPAPFLYEGRESIAALMETAYGEHGMGEWRLVAAWANRQPAAASYLRRPDSDEWIAFKLDVLRVRGDRIAEITTFDHTLFPEFGLPGKL
jgi:hypothetical protein